MMRLKRITLLRDRVESWEKYPFNVPAIRTLDEIEIKSKICFFVGENGSGKSTLLEAVAAHYGFGREGGSRSFYRVSTDSVSSIDPLVKALRVAFSKIAGCHVDEKLLVFGRPSYYLDPSVATIRPRPGWLVTYVVLAANLLGQRL